MPLSRDVVGYLAPTPRYPAPPEPLTQMLPARGLVHVEAWRFELPIGSWGGVVGTAMLSNFRALMGAGAPALETQLRIPTLDTLGLVGRSTEEIERDPTVAPLWFVWGRPPAGPTT